MRSRISVLFMRVIVVMGAPGAAGFGRSLMPSGPPGFRTGASTIRFDPPPGEARRTRKGRAIGHATRATRTDWEHSTAPGSNPDPGAYRRGLDPPRVAPRHRQYVRG